MKNYLNIAIKKEEIEKILKRIKELSGIDNDLSVAIANALYFVESKKDEREIFFIQRLLRGIASGTVKLDFDIYKLYKSV